VFIKAGQHVLTVSMDVTENDSVEALKSDVLALARAAVAKLR